MNPQKMLAGGGVFILTLCAAIFGTRYLMTLAPTPPGANANVMSQPLNPGTSAARVTHRVQLITLERQSQRAYTKLTLERDEGAPAPTRVWVWTYFFTPHDKARRSWSSEPIEVREPFRDGSHRITVTVNSSCHWCDDASASAAGRSSYYARVNVSTESKDAAALRDEQLNLDIVSAAPVVVQGEEH